MDDPAAGLGRRWRGILGLAASGGGEDVVEALSAGIGAIWIDGRRVRLELLLSAFRPAPGVVEAVAGRAVELDVVAGSRHGEASSLLRGVVCGAEGAVRMEDAPGVFEGRAGGDDAVGE